MKQYFKPHEILTKKEPADLGMVYTSVQRVEVGAEPVALESGAEELCFICIGGRVDYQTEGQSGTAVQMDMLYLPIESGITFTSSEGGVMMRYGAPCTRRTKFGHIRFADVDKDSRHKVYGKVENGTRRDVWNYIDESFDSSRFLTGICHGAGRRLDRMAAPRARQGARGDVRLLWHGQWLCRTVRVR